MDSVVKRNLDIAEFDVLYHDNSHPVIKLCVCVVAHLVRLPLMSEMSYQIHYLNCSKLIANGMGGCFIFSYSILIIQRLN